MIDAIVIEGLKAEGLPDEHIKEIEEYSFRGMVYRIIQILALLRNSRTMGNCTNWLLQMEALVALETLKADGLIGEYEEENPEKFRR